MVGITHVGISGAIVVLRDCLLWGVIGFEGVGFAGVLGFDGELLGSASDTFATVFLSLRLVPTVKAVSRCLYSF